ncbi:hypothetical protein EIB75_02665 [Epilithonimonas vandammei]|uniref:30S ribosomal protein S10 n=1 Tax=Epilithonimonas vandammei TaxID=2487072 RepID=A0A3G8ZSA0_9FLAO|nr:hypothetical protein EIB75_02665 [Epilithonimonas vandammei]
MNPLNWLCVRKSVCIWFSRKQFQLSAHKRLMDIYSSSKTVDALMKLELPSGVDVEIKV